MAVLKKTSLDLDLLNVLNFDGVGRSARKNWEPCSYYYFIASFTEVQFKKFATNGIKDS